MLQNILLFSLFVLCLQCSKEHVPGTTTSTEKTDTITSFPEGTIRYQEVVDKIMKPICLDCHKKNMSTYEQLLARVVPGDPEKSKFYLRAKTDMPPIFEGYPPLTDDELELIYNWIAQGAVN